MNVKKRTIVVMGIISILLCGCGNSLLNAEIIEETAETTVETTAETTAETTQDSSNNNTDKAEPKEIEGTNAFYILESVPRPVTNQIIDFKVLDLIDGKKTVYAYQALLTKVKTEETTINGKEMETVLMIFEPFTHESKVLYREVTPYDKSTSDKDAAKNDEMRGFFAQKIENKSLYFLYFNGHAYIYNLKGERIYKRNVTEILEDNRKKFGKDAVLTVTNVVCDSTMYIHMLITIDNNNKINENTSENEIRNYQMLFSMFEYDVGVRKGADSSYFFSENLNYSNQLEEWEKFNEIDFGNNKPDEDAVNEAVKNQISNILDRYNDTYLCYHYCDPVMPLYLSYNGVRGDGLFSEIYVKKYKENQFLTPAEVNKNMNSINKLSYTATMDPQKVLPTVFIYPNGKIDEQIKKVVLHKKEIILKWTETNTTTVIDEDEKEHEETETIEHEDTTEVSAGFTKQYEFRFPEHTMASWSKVEQTASMITESITNGICRYYFEGNGEKTRIEFAQSGSTDVKGSAQKFLICYGNEPVLIAMTTDSLNIIKDATVVKSINNDIVNFGLSSQGNLHDDWKDLEERQEIHIQEDPKNPNVQVNPKGDAVRYSDHSVIIRKEGGKFFLYLASVDSGIVKYNLSINDPVAGQVASYPYYSIWEGEKNCLYAIGYESLEYSYSEKDLFNAKIYQIDLSTQDTAFNLLASVLKKNKDPNMKKNGQNLIENLNIIKKEAAMEYLDYVNEGDLAKERALNSFYKIAGIDIKNINKEQLNEMNEKVASCIYTKQLEDLIIEWKFGAKEIKYIEQLRNIYNMTEEQWTRSLEIIAFNLNVPENIDEFQKKTAINMFVRLADTYPRNGMYGEIKKCKDIKELQNLVISYYKSTLDKDIEYEDSKLLYERKSKFGEDSWNEDLIEIFKTFH